MTKYFVTFFRFSNRVAVPFASRPFGAPFFDFRCFHLFARDKKSSSMFAVSAEIFDNDDSEIPGRSRAEWRAHSEQSTMKFENPSNQLIVVKATLFRTRNSLNCAYFPSAPAQKGPFNRFRCTLRFLLFRLSQSRGDALALFLLPTSTVLDSNGTIIDGISLRQKGTKQKTASGTVLSQVQSESGHVRRVLSRTRSGERLTRLLINPAENPKRSGRKRQPDNAI